MKSIELKLIELLNKSGKVCEINESPNNIIQFKYNPTNSSIHYPVVLLKDLERNELKMTMANNKIEMNISLDDNQELIIKLLYYYVKEKRDPTNSEEPILNVIRDMLKYFNHVIVDDKSFFKCDEPLRKIPYSLIPFVNYNKLQLYEGIVDTPRIALDIRNVLENKKMLYLNICDIDTESLSNKLKIMIEHGNNDYIQDYESAHNFLNDSSYSNFPQYTRLGHSAKLLNLNGHKQRIGAIIGGKIKTAKKIKDKETAKKIKDKETAKKIKDKETAKKIKDKETAKKIKDKETAKKIKDKETAVLGVLNPQGSK